MLQGTTKFIYTKLELVQIKGSMIMANMYSFSEASFGATQGSRNQKSTFLLNFEELSYSMIKYRKK